MRIKNSNRFIIIAITILVILVNECELEQINDENTLETSDIEFQVADLTVIYNSLETGDVQLEAFKSTLNNQIMLDAQQQNSSTPVNNKYEQLTWLSIGNPTILNTSIASNDFQLFHFTSEGFYCFVQMLTAQHRALFKDMVKYKYEIDVNISQIVNLPLSVFKCSFELYDVDTKSVVVLTGSVKQFNKFPLKLQFNFNKDTKERIIFEKRLRQDGSSLDLNLNCDLASVGRSNKRITNKTDRPKGSKSRYFDKSADEEYNSQAPFQRKVILETANSLGVSSVINETFQAIKKLENLIYSKEIDLRNQINNSISNTNSYINSSTSSLRASINYLSFNTSKSLSNLKLDADLVVKAERILSLAVLPDGNFASASGRVIIWNASNLTAIRTFDANTGGLVTMLKSGYLASCNGNNINIWDLASGRLNKTLVGFSDPAVRSIVGLSDGSLVMGGGGYSQSNTIYIWNVRDATIRLKFGQPSNVVNALAVLPNDDIVSALEDNRIIIWNSYDGSVKKALTGHTGPVKSLTVLKNGDLASGSTDQTIKIWDTLTGSLKYTLNGHTSTIGSLDVLPNGFLISSGDQTIRIWDTINQPTLKKTLIGPTNYINKVAVLPNGDILGASEDLTLSLWRNKL